MFVMRRRVWYFLGLVFASAIDAITTTIVIPKPGIEEASPPIAAFIQHTPHSWHLIGIFIGCIIFPWLVFMYLGRVNKPNSALGFIQGSIIIQILAAINNFMVISPNLTQTKASFIIVYLIPVLIYTRGIYIDYNRDKLMHISVHRRQKGWKKIIEVKNRLSLPDPD